MHLSAYNRVRVRIVRCGFGRPNRSGLENGPAGINTPRARGPNWCGKVLLLLLFAVAFAVWKLELMKRGAQAHTSWQTNLCYGVQFSEVALRDWRHKREYFAHVYYPHHVLEFACVCILVRMDKRVCRSFPWRCLCLCVSVSRKTGDMLTAHSITHIERERARHFHSAHLHYSNFTGPYIEQNLLDGLSTILGKLGTLLLIFYISWLAISMSQIILYGHDQD